MTLYLQDWHVAQRDPTTLFARSSWQLFHGILYPQEGVVKDKVPGENHKISTTSLIPRPTPLETTVEGLGTGHIITKDDSKAVLTTSHTEWKNSLASNYQAEDRELMM